MDKPNRCDELDNIHYSTEQKDYTATETIPPNRNNTNTYNPSIDKSPSYRHSQDRYSPRTTFNTYQPFPNIPTQSQQTETGNKPSQHLQSENTTFVHSNCTYPSSATTNTDLPGTVRVERKRGGDDTEYTGSSGSTSRIKTTRADTTNKPSISKNHNDTDGPITNTHTDKSATYYTFIIHKHNLSSFPNPTTSDCPTFATFDHGTTSSTPPPSPTTIREHLTASFSSLIVPIQELQRQIQHNNRYASRPDSWHILHVKVFPHSTSIEIQQSPASRT
jgi:hypothetical protein